MSLMMRFRRIPPVNVHITYALGITTLFPNLKDPDSKNGYVSVDIKMQIFTGSVLSQVIDKFLLSFCFF